MGILWTQVKSAIGKSLLCSVTYDVYKASAMLRFQMLDFRRLSIYPWKPGKGLARVLKYCLDPHDALRSVGFAHAFRTFTYVAAMVCHCIKFTAHYNYYDVCWECKHWRASLDEFVRGWLSLQPVIVFLIHSSARLGWFSGQYQMRKACAWPRSVWKATQGCLSNAFLNWTRGKKRCFFYYRFSLK